MKFGSVCSGIEAASVAFGPLGWKAAWFSEIEKFPCAVLAHHYPDVPNLGDMTRIKDDERFTGSTIDVLCGGTPCQSFSVAGLRKGLSDERGNLSLLFCELSKLKRPRWVMWENVPGVLSSKDNAFGCFLAGLAGHDAPLLPGTKDGRWGSAGIVSASNKDGYGLAWRVLDAQHFGVPQRRRRVFVVGYLGDWKPATEVLFEPKSCGGSVEEIRGGLIRGRGKNVLGCLSTRTGAYDRQELDTLIFNYQDNTVRLLTPKEQERAQGFPDGYTAIPYNGKSADKCPDGPRYKALGNSWAVPCARWIGQRITEVDRRLSK